MSKDAPAAVEEKPVTLDDVVNSLVKQFGSKGAVTL